MRVPSTVEGSPRNRVSAECESSPSPPRRFPMLRDVPPKRIDAPVSRRCSPASAPLLRSADPTLPVREPPVSTPRFEKSDGADTTLIVPPSASLPYSTDPGPRTTSIRSATAVSIQLRYWLGPDRHAAVLSRTPSTRYTLLCPVKPLMIGEAWAVVVCCSSTPGSSRRICGSSCDGRASISRRVVTESDSGTLKPSSATPREGVTTTSVRNLRTGSTNSARALPAVRSTGSACASNRADDAVTRHSVARRPDTSNSPAAFVVACRSVAPQTMETAAPPIAPPC